MSERNLITREQLAERCAVSPRTVDNLRRKGLPTVYVGAAPRFDYDQVIAWLLSRCTGHTMASAVSALKGTKK